MNNIAVIVLKWFAQVVEQSAHRELYEVETKTLSEEAEREDTGMFYDKELAAKTFSLLRYLSAHSATLFPNYRAFQKRLVCIKINRLLARMELIKAPDAKIQHAFLFGVFKEYREKLFMYNAEYFNRCSVSVPDFVVSYWNEITLENLFDVDRNSAWCEVAGVLGVQHFDALHYIQQNVEERMKQLDIEAHKQQEQRVREWSMLQHQSGDVSVARLRQLQSSMEQYMNQYRNRTQEQANRAKWLMGVEGVVLPQLQHMDKLIQQHVDELHLIPGMVVPTYKQTQAVYNHILSNLIHQPTDMNNPEWMAACLTEATELQAERQKIWYSDTIQKQQMEAYKTTAREYHVDRVYWESVERQNVLAEKVIACLQRIQSEPSVSQLIITEACSIIREQCINVVEHNDGDDEKQPDTGESKRALITKAAVEFDISTYFKSVLQSVYSSVTVDKAVRYQQMVALIEVQLADAIPLESSIASRELELVEQKLALEIKQQIKEEFLVQCEENVRAIGRMIEQSILLPLQKKYQQEQLLQQTQSDLPTQLSFDPVPVFPVNVQPLREALKPIIATMNWSNSLENRHSAHMNSIQSVLMSSNNNTIIPFDRVWHCIQTLLLIY